MAGPVIPLYRVSFLMTDIWSDYKGNSSDGLYIEIYDHWLAAADLSAAPDQGTPT